MPGQTRLPLGARHFRLPLSPRSATTSYAPQITSGWPSPSRSATAGEEYQPVWQYGPGKQPPYCHFKTGALTTATLKVAVTDFAAVIVTVQIVPETVLHPLQLLKVDPAAGVAASVTIVPLSDRTVHGHAQWSARGRERRAAFPDPS